MYLCVEIAKKQVFPSAFIPLMHTPTAWSYKRQKCVGAFW